MTDELRESWPDLPWREWQPTISTLHLWTQIVGKVRMALTPPLNHWWHVPLYVSARGLTTSLIPYRGRSFQVDFDFIDDHLSVVDSGGGLYAMPLRPITVAAFYRDLMDGLRSLDVEVEISTRPVEVVDAIRFDLDEEHHSYVSAHARAFWQGAVQADRVMREYQSGFAGKASPVHFFWGSFDLATTRYSGRGAPLHRGGAPNCPTWVMEEAYSREEISLGWWPSSDPPGPSFYAYAYPEPDGFSSTAAAGASYDSQLGEFILPYDTVRQAADPDAAAQEFFQSVYEAGAELGGWDRQQLETHLPSGRAPTEPWSTLPLATKPGMSSAGDGGPAGHGHRHRAHPAGSTRLV